MPFTNTTALVSISSSELMSSEETRCQSNWLHWIMNIQPIFLLIFGFLANLFAAAILFQPRLRRRPTFSYLAFLSLTNAFLSLIHAFFTILGVYFELTLENLPLFPFCRLLNRFLIDFLTHLSFYTLTAVDLDRVRTVTSSTNTTRRYSNPSTSRCVPAFVRVCLIELLFVSILFALNLHWLTSYGEVLPGVPPITMCTILSRNDSSSSSSMYEKYLTSVLPSIELVFFGIVPFTISLVATIIILRHVSTKDSLGTNQQMKRSRRRMELHLSVLLISLNCVFLLCTTPHNIFNVFLGQYHRTLDRQQQSEGELCSVAVTQKSLDLLQQCYFMSTFFLYILTNRRFRAEFFRLMECFLIFLRACRPPPKETPETREPVNRRLTTHPCQVPGNHLMVPTPMKDYMSDVSDYDDDDDNDEAESNTRLAL